MVRQHDYLRFAVGKQETARGLLTTHLYVLQLCLSGSFHDRVIVVLGMKTSADYQTAIIRRSVWVIKNRVL